MAINKDFIGRTFMSKRPYLVGREKIREFADAIGDTNPIYTDVDAAQAAGHPDLVAPTTFPFTIAFAEVTAGPVADPALNLNYAFIVHGEQSFKYVRPLYAGDEVVVESTISDITSRGRNEFMTVTQEIKTVAGESVVTLTNVLVSRGTAEVAEA